MTSTFRAWHLAPEFSRVIEEVVADRRVTGDRNPEVSSMGGQGPAAGFEYPVFSLPRLREIMRGLREARNSYLVSLPVSEVVTIVDRLARRFLDPADPLAGRAVDGLEFLGGYSRPMAEVVLAGMARGWTGENLRRLLRTEFPRPEVLDSFSPDDSGGQVRALGFPLTFHLGAGSVPGVATTALIRALMVKSAVLLKPGLGDLVLPVLFAHALAEEDEDLARSVAVLYWPGGDGDRTETAMAGADLVVTYSSDQTVRWVRERLPPHVPLRAYRHRLGLGLVGREVLEMWKAGEMKKGLAWRSAAAAARAVALFDQRGCVSPHVFLVEEGGDLEPDGWATLLAKALEELEGSLPSGPLSPDDAVAVQHLRGEAEMAEGLGVGKVVHGGDKAPWTVVFLEDGEIEPSCLNRTVRVLAVKDVDEALRKMAGWGWYLQTVGVSGFRGRMEDLREELARLGVSRITDLEQVPWPEAWWHHDGSGPLRDLVRWTDVEGLGTFSSGDGEG